MRIRYAFVLSVFAVGLSAFWFASCAGSSDGSDDDNTNIVQADDAQDDDSSEPETGTPFGAIAPPPGPFDPTRPGPYAVGVKTFVFIDEARNDFASRGKRTLLTEIWYPAGDWTRELPRDAVRNFLGRWWPLIHLVFNFLVPPDEIANFDAQRDAARDAPLLPQSDPYPLVLISHGNAGIRFASMSLAEYLASHGYIVVAPDHIGNAIFVTLPDRLQIYNPILTPFEFTDRIRDFMFLIDEMTRQNDEPDGMFEGRVDLSRIGVIGHSFGGTSATETEIIDERVGAAVDMASFMIPLWRRGYDKPVMFMLGLEDHTMDSFESFIKFVDFPINPRPKWLLQWTNAGHYTFTDACVLIPTLLGDGDGCGTAQRRDTGEEFTFIGHDLAQKIMGTYITAFFDYTLRGEDAMLDVLEANLFPDELTLTYKLDGKTTTAP